jgi:exopolysaccharide production protein ExoQ
MISNTDTLLGIGFQAFFWLIAVFWMCGHVKAILDACRKMKVLLALSLLAPLSAVWSQNPANSFRRGTFLALGTLFAFSLVRAYDADELAQIVVIAGVGAGMLGIFTCLFVPQVGLDAGNGDAWQGIFRSKNGCAQVMLFFLTPALSFKFRSRIMGILRYSMFCVAFVLIVMANAKTAWILTPAYVLLVAVSAMLKRLARRDATVLAALLPFWFRSCCPWFYPF